MSDRRVDDRIEPEINGLVLLEIDCIENHRSIADAHILGERLMFVAAQSWALDKVDRIMAVHRNAFLEDISPEWRALDAAWSDLREAIGLKR